MNNEKKNLKILDYFKTFSEEELINEHWSFYVKNPRIKIAYNDFDILKKSDNYLSYSQIIFNNKKNYRVFIWILFSYLSPLFFLLLDIIFLIFFLALNFFITNSSKVLLYLSWITILITFLVQSFFGITILTRIKHWSLLKHHFITKILNSYNRPPGSKNWQKIFFFATEFLKCMYESCNNLEFSKKRIEEITNNFNSFYYLFDVKDKQKYKNREVKFLKFFINKILRLNPSNYVERINKIGIILNKHGLIIYLPLQLINIWVTISIIALIIVLFNN